MPPPAIWVDFPRVPQMLKQIPRDVFRQSKVSSVTDRSTPPLRVLSIFPDSSSLLTVVVRSRTISLIFVPLLDQRLDMIDHFHFDSVSSLAGALRRVSKDPFPRSEAWQISCKISASPTSRMIRVDDPSSWCFYWVQCVLVPAGIPITAAGK